MPQTVAHHDKSPKNKRNPKPSPIGNNFGILSFGSPCWARTSDNLYQHASRPTVDIAPCFLAV